MIEIKDAIAAMRETLKLNEDVRCAVELLKAVALEMREHDRRLARLETQWDTLMRVSATRRPRSAAKSKE